MHLNRNHIFLIGLVTAFLFAGINIFNFYAKSGFASGQLLSWDGNVPIIYFELDGNYYRFNGEYDVQLSQRENITVIYDKNNPGNAAVFSFSGFFLRYFIILILPIMLWAAFIYSWMGRYDFVIVDFKNKIFRKTNKNNLPDKF